MLVYQCIAMLSTFRWIPSQAMTGAFRLEHSSFFRLCSHLHGIAKLKRCNRLLVLKKWSFQRSFTTPTQRVKQLGEGEETEKLANAVADGQ